MNQTIESVDNLPKATVNNKVHQADKSKEEKDQKTFDDELKEKMKKKNKSETEDTLIIEQTIVSEQDKNEEKKNDEKSEDRQAESAEEKSKDDNSDSETPHIDLKI
ncbi:MAG: hypothetical protein ABIJ12_08490 [bacterium]